MADDPQIESSSGGKRRMRATRGEEDALVDQFVLGNMPDEFGEEDEQDDLIEGDDLDDAFLSSWTQDIDDDEITTMLDNTREARQHLKTGGLEELAEDFAEFEDQLGSAGLGKLSGSRRRGGTGDARLPREAKEVLGRANALYIAQDYGQAIDLLQDLIKDHPTVHQAWNTLGLVHEDMGNHEKSLRFRMIAAHISQNDVELWKELGIKSSQNDATQQAIYCLTKAITVDPTDADALWDRSYLYKKIGKSDSAIDGFEQVLELVPHHFKVINELAQLYRAKGRTQEAIQLYERSIEFHTKNSEDEEDEEDEEEREDKEDASNDFKDKLGFTEINMLSELYLMLNDYRRSLDCIKNGIRHVQRRQDESWWLDHTEDDDEYFEEAEGDDDDVATDRTDFPIELRVRMGICRLYLGQVQLAIRHFNYLLKYPATAYPDLHQDIAYAYMDKRHYELAVVVFQKIIDVSDEVEVDILIRTADCYHQVGELETAVLFYTNVLNERPENLDIMLSLATVYEEQGNEEQALQLVDLVMKKNREAQRKQKSADSQDVAATEDGQAFDTTDLPKESKTKASLFDEKHRHTPSENRRTAKEQFLLDEEEKERNAQALFVKIAELDRLMGPEVASMDRAMMREYMRCAQDLWADFRQVRAFYPSIRAQRYEGFYALRRGKGRAQKNPSVSFEAHKLAHRLRRRATQEDSAPPIPRHDAGVSNEEHDDDDEIQMREEEEQQIRMSEAEHFRGQTFETWLRVLIKYAYMLAMTRRTEDAYELLRKAYEANVFYHDVPKKTAIKLALLGCALYNRNDAIVAETTRWLCNFYQFKSDPFRIYGAAMSSGSHDVVSYASAISLKYLIRSIRLMDAVVARERQRVGEDALDVGLEGIQELNDAILAMNMDPSAANEQNYNRFYYVPKHLQEKDIQRMGNHAPKNVNPLLLYLFGQVMSLGKNYLAAAMFFMRAYALAPTDPLIILSLAIAHLQRAMQRKTDNRHRQVMQGMKFLQEYAEQRGVTQEAEYNVARGYHLLGITHLAVPHYERVLVLPSDGKCNPMEPLVLDEDVLKARLQCVYELPEDEAMEEEEEEEEEQDMTDLKREAAYNLHLIYVASGSVSLAQILLQKFCTL